jgi:AcrR family transcriptional regulator
MLGKSGVTLFCLSNQFSVPPNASGIRLIKAAAAARRSATLVKARGAITSHKQTQIPAAQREAIAEIWHDRRYDISEIAAKAEMSVRSLYRLFGSRRTVTRNLQQGTELYA